MTDVSTDTGPPPVFGPDGRMMGNQTSNQGQPPQAAPALAPQSPLATMGMPPAPTPPPPQQHINAPPMPRMPAEQKLGPAPDAREYEKNSMAFASAMAVIGAIAGRFTRQPGGAALGAFAGALKGWQTGNLEMYESATKKWELDTKATIENNRQVMEKYKLALENRKMNIDEQMSNIQLISAQYHDQVMYDAAASKNYTLVAQIYEKNWEYTNGPKGVEATFEKLREPLEKQRIQNQTQAAKWASLEGQMELEAVKPDGTPKYDTAFKARVKQLIELYGGESGGQLKQPAGGLKGQLIAEENAERQARGEPPMTAAQSRDFTLAPPRSAPAMALRKFMETHPDADENAITKFSATYNEAQARARSLGTRSANVDVAVTEAQGAAKEAIKRSAAVPRGEFVPINQLAQAAQKAGSSSALGRFEIANSGLITAYSQTMSRTGTNTVTAQNRAMEVLSTATGPEAYRERVEQLLTEMDIVKQAVKDVEGGGADSTQAPTGGGIPSGWDVKVH